MAVCCESVAEEISKPNARQVSVNKMLSNTNKARLPLIGTSSTNTLNNKMLAILTIDNMQVRNGFGNNDFKGCIGDTSMISIVPNSFSFTMVMAVIIVHTSISTIAITPGTILYAPFSCGLYSIRVSVLMVYGSFLSLVIRSW